MLDYIHRKHAVSEFTLETAQTPQQCIDVLRKKVKKPLPWFLPDFFVRQDSYRGTVSDNGQFSICRITTIQDISDETDEDGKTETSTPLLVSGAITPGATGAHIHVVLRPRRFSRGITILLYALGLLSLFGTFGSLLDISTTVERFGAMLALALLWIALGWFLSRYVSSRRFEIESVRAREYLRALFKADQVIFGPRNDNQ